VTVVQVAQPISGSTPTLPGGPQPPFGITTAILRQL
jgi:hypothetical protein